MLDILHNIEKDIRTLCEDRDGWQTLDVTYHPPHVERVWRDIGEYRLSLHRIHPCDAGDALFHPHPWASAIYIASGEYEMGIAEQTNLTWTMKNGAYSGTVAKPSIDRLAAKMILPAGTYYEMTDPTAWHYVRPLRLVHSVMVTGRIDGDWKKVPQPKKESHVPKELERGVKHDILGFFRMHYLDKSAKLRVA